MKKHHKEKTTKEIQDEIDKLVDELSKIKTKLSKGDFEILQKHDLKLRELELRKKEVISKLKDEFANSKELDELTELRNETKEQLDEILEKIKVNNSKRESVEQSTKFKKGEINNLKLRGQTIVENVKTFKQQELQEITCPKCNHVFKHANEDVKVNVEKQVKEAKGLKGQIEQLEQDVKDFNEEIDELNEILETYQSDREELTNKLVEQDENVATLRESNEKALESLLEHKDVLSVVKEIKDLETTKNEELLNHTINVKKLEAKQVRLTEQRDELYQQRYALDNVEKAKEKVLEISKELKDTQKTINNFEKLQIDLKILEQKYLKAIDENIKQSFGENIRFKMFETNMSNENLIPTCEMYVKDQFGNWLPAVNGINTGHSVPRLVEFLVKVRKSLNIKKWFAFN